MSDYRLDDGVRSLAETDDFCSSLCVQTSSEAHTASYPMGNVSSFQGVRRGRGVTLTTHPRLVPRSRMSSSCTSPPHWRLHCGSGKAFYTEVKETLRKLEHKSLGMIYQDELSE
jgi:hypothetical protein